MPAIRSASHRFPGVLALGFAGAMLIGTPALAQNLLTNPGFEADAAMGQAPVPLATGWNLGNTGTKNTVSAPDSPVRSGVGALELIGSGAFGVPLGMQTLPAQPGETYDLQGYVRVNSVFSGQTRALLKIVFSGDTNLGIDLEPASISIGTADSQPFPGIIAAPLVSPASPTDQWIFTQARGVAPAGTTAVIFFAILVDENPATAYFDDLQATRIPEPTSWAVALTGLAMTAAWRRRRSRLMPR